MQYNVKLAAFPGTSSVCRLQSEFHNACDKTLQVSDNKAMLYISIIITNEEKLLSGRSAQPLDVKYAKMICPARA